MYHTFRYRMDPTGAHGETLDRHRDIYRQAYNPFLYRLDQFNGMPEMTTLRDELPNLIEVYSRALQKMIERLYDNLDSLAEVGIIEWLPRQETGG